MTNPTHSTLDKRKLFVHLNNYFNVRLKQSSIHGICVVATEFIRVNTRLISINESISNELIDLTEEEVKDHMQELTKAFVLQNEDGTFPVSDFSLFCRIGMDMHCNSSFGTISTSNIEFGIQRDESGYIEIIASRHRKRGRAFSSVQD